jgi:hypothetical protein
VPINVIALWLGHESPTTTHQYVEANLAMKEKALGEVFRDCRNPDAAKLEPALPRLAERGLAKRRSSSSSFQTPPCDYEKLRTGGCECRAKHAPGGVLAGLGAAYEV